MTGTGGTGTGGSGTFTGQFFILFAEKMSALNI